MKPLLIVLVISAATGMTTKDIITTLLDLGMLKYMRTKYFIVNDKVGVLRLRLFSKFPLLLKNHLVELEFTLNYSTAH